MRKIYTKIGDEGETYLGDKSFVFKDELRLEVIGSLDELKCHLGIVSAILRKEKLEKKIKEEIIKILEQIEEQLFNLLSYFALSKDCEIKEKDVAWIEEEIDKISEKLPEIKNFLKNPTSEISATLQLARAVCRGVERKTVSLLRKETLNKIVIPYLNRLSDLLFILARFLEVSLKHKEKTWEKGNKK